MIYTNRFTTRKEAAAFAKANNSKVERCPAEGANRDAYFKYQVLTEGIGRRPRAEEY